MKQTIDNDMRGSAESGTQPDFTKARADLASLREKFASLPAGAISQGRLDRASSYMDSLEVILQNASGPTLDHLGDILGVKRDGETA